MALERLEPHFEEEHLRMARGQTSARTSWMLSSIHEIPRLANVCCPKLPRSMGFGPVKSTVFRDPRNHRNVGQARTVRSFADNSYRRTLG